MAGTYLKRRCSGCGGRVEVTRPQTHVFSRHTGATYCATCAVKGLPPKHKRPKEASDMTVAPNATEKAPKAEAPAKPKENNVLSAAMRKALDELKDLTLVAQPASADKDKTLLDSGPRSFAVKAGKTLVATVLPRRSTTKQGGKRMFVVNFKTDPAKTMKVVEVAQVAKVVAELELRTPAKERTAKADPKPSARKKSTAKGGTNADGSKGGTRSAAKAAA